MQRVAESSSERVEQPVSCLLVATDAIPVGCVHADAGWPAHGWCGQVAR